MDKETNEILQMTKIYNYKEERVIFIMSKGVLLSLSLFSMFFTGTHGKSLFVCAFVYMLTIFSDYFSLYRTTQKTDKSWKISTTLFVLCLIFTGIFFIGMVIPINVSEDLNYITFFKTDKEVLFKFPCVIVEIILYIIMILASTFYIMEMTGILNRKLPFSSENN